MLNFYFLWVLSNVAVGIICWNERDGDVLHRMHSFLITFFLTFRNFCLCVIIFVPTIFVNDMLLREALSGVAQNTFPNVLLDFNISQFY